MEETRRRISLGGILLGVLFASGALAAVTWLGRGAGGSFEGWLFGAIAASLLGSAAFCAVFGEAHPKRIVRRIALSATAMYLPYVFMMCYALVRMNGRSAPFTGLWLLPAGPGILPALVIDGFHAIEGTGIVASWIVAQMGFLMLVAWRAPRFSVFAAAVFFLLHCGSAWLILNFPVC